MHWYGGSIAEAVTLSKQKNTIFVVFVEGDNDLSAEMSTTIDDTAVVSRLSNETNFLAVKLKSGTPNYTHFAQIYQFVPVPSLFFIGRNGTPLEVVCAGVQPTNLASRIDRILAEHHKGKPVQSPVQPSTSAQQVKQNTEALIESEARAEAAAAPAPAAASAPATASATATAPATASAPATAPVETQESETASDSPSEATPAKVARTEQQYQVICEGDVCRRVKVDQPSTSQATTPPTTPVDEIKPDIAESSSSVSIDDKMDRAKELIEARRREKADKEKELEKQKEIERRNQGQGVAELKRWQAEQELKQIQEERKREKLENNLARQRILAQIAQDRAERRARDAPVAAPPAAAPPAAAPPPRLVAEPTPTSGDSSPAARVQFKLPDGTSHTAHFTASTTLATVQQYVGDNLQLPMSSFALWTAFPRRELTEAARSLSELQLAPSAALLVLPRRLPPLQPHSSSVFSVFTFITNLLTSLIYEPSLQLLSWVRGRLFPPAPLPPARPPSPPTTQRPLTRRRTNIHRLPGDANSDDDNNTWNGNSTQQM